MDRAGFITTAVTAVTDVTAVRAVIAITTVTNVLMVPAGTAERNLVASAEIASETIRALRWTPAEASARYTRRLESELPDSVNRALTDHSHQRD